MEWAAMAIIFLLSVGMFYLLGRWIDKIENLAQENHELIQTILDRRAEQRQAMESDRARIKRLEERIKAIQQRGEG